MAFNYLNGVRDPLFPLSNDQDERILIEFDGILHSEAETIFYGLKDCPILEAHPFNTYDRLLNKKPLEVYEEIGYFRPEDLIKYLNDGEDFESGEIPALIEYAKNNYDYSVATQMNMLGALQKLITTDFVKQITFVVEKYRVNNLYYLIDMLGKDNLNKKAILLQVPDGQTISAMKGELEKGANDNVPYTTIITNEYKLILDVLNDYKKYKADTAFFLLRNHSQNMKQMINGESVHFTELYTDKILEAINGSPDIEKFSNFEFPVKAKFARFSPTPFITDSPNYMVFGNQEDSPK